MKRLILLSERMTLGGAQTLMYRIAREAKKLNIETVLHCKVLVDAQKQLLDEFKILVVVHRKWFNPKAINLEDDDVVITLLPHDYLKCKEHATRWELQCKILLYIVHPLALVNFCRPTSLIRYLSKVDICNGIRSGNIIFMDQQCIDTTFEKYRFDFSREEAVIVRLPIEMQPACSDEDIIRRIQNFEILTVTRSAFPFKGYVRGLIQVFNNICRESRQHLSLVIVTATSPGNDVDTMKRWIEESPFKDKITLALNVDNTSLRDYYASSSLYIGMGTTILEAAERSVPAVSVEAYTYDCLADYWFFKKPGDLVVREGEGRSIEPLIENLLAIDSEEYLSIARASRNAVAVMYTFNAFFDCVFKTGNKQNNISFSTALSWRFRYALHRVKKFFKSSVK